MLTNCEIKERTENKNTRQKGKKMKIIKKEVCQDRNMMEVKIAIHPYHTKLSKNTK